MSDPTDAVNQRLKGIEDALAQNAAGLNSLHEGLRVVLERLDALSQAVAGAAYAANGACEFPRGDIEDQLAEILAAIKRR